MARFRIRRLGRPLLIVAAAGALIAVAAILWVAQLDRRVVQEFQGRHWSVPARVFAAPLELYVGAPISANDLEDELRRLHYRRGDPASGPGMYRRTGNAFDISTRRVRFIDELREPQRVSIHADAPRSPACGRRDGGDLPVFRLDPPVDRQPVSHPRRGPAGRRARRRAAAAAATASS